MAFFSRLRTNLNLNQLKHRYFASSSILASGNNAPLTSKEKTRAALTLLKSESNPGRILEICRAASLTPDTHLDRLAFSLAIDKLSEANHFNGISQFLEELKTRPDSHRNERLIAHTIILYGQAKMTDHAVRTFKEMDKYGLRHSVRAFNALLFSFLLANEHKEVKRIFLELPKMYGIEPDMDTYNKVIKSCAESGDTSSGYSILAEMDRKSIKPNATSFQILLAGFYQERKFDDVGKVLQMIEKYGMKPRLSIYNTRILGLCKLKKSAEAKALLDGMLSRGMKPNKVTYNHLIYGFCKEGNLEEAKKLYKIMINGGFKPDRECYSTLVYFLGQGGDYETALMVCKQSIEKSWVPNFTTMKSLVEGLASVSKVAEAKELVGLVKTKFTNNVEVWNEVEAKLPQ